MLVPFPAAIRRYGRLTLILAAGFLLVNFLALTVQGVSDAWLHFGIWAGCTLISWVTLQRRLPSCDPLLLAPPLLMSGWGLLLIDRLAPNFAMRQTVWLVVGTAAMLTVALLPQPLRWLREYRYVLLLTGLALLVGTILVGSNPSGLAGAPELWLGVGSVFFQPSEALKIILAAFLASYLAEQQPALMFPAPREQGFWSRFSPRLIGPTILMWAICVVILVWQRDLGTAMLFFTVFLLLFYTASGKTVILLLGAGLVVLAGITAYLAFAVVQLRVDIWLNPWPEADNRAFQIVQSLLAFAAGGAFGQGIGQGAATFIPVVHSDFVFAALAEEWGLLGVIVTLVCVAMLVARGFSAALRQRRSAFPGMLGVGLSLMLGVQSLFIMGGVLKLVPLTGVTLPFMSYGGSSLLVSFIMLGLLLRLSAVEI